MSPYLFNVFMNIFIVHLRLLDVGCHVNHQYIRCFLYGDDILISTSIIGLQKMLVVCSATAKSFGFKFNGNKSHCLSFDKLANVDLDPMLFDNQSITWCYSIRYLGVHLLSGKDLFFDIAHIKRAFYTACNNIIFLIIVMLMKSSRCPTHFKKHIAYQFCYMLHLLFIWNLSNYQSWKFAGISFIAKKMYFSERKSIKLFIFGLVFVLV